MTDYTTIKYLAKNCSIEVNVKCLVVTATTFSPRQKPIQSKKKKAALPSSSKIKLKY